MRAVPVVPVVPCLDIFQPTAKRKCIDKVVPSLTLPGKGDGAEC